MLLYAIPFLLTMAFPFAALKGIHSRETEPNQTKPETDIKQDLKKQKLEYTIQCSRYEIEHSLAEIDILNNQLSGINSECKKALSIRNKIYNANKRIKKSQFQAQQAYYQLRTGK